MAEREEKLAAARKRLKKFQSKKTPSSSPVVLGKFGSKNKPVDDELSTSFKCDDVVSQPSKDFLDNKLQDKTVPVEQENAKSPNQESIPFSNGSPAEKIRQMCNQLNGLNSQDLMINGEVPSINEIESLESRNRELEESLQSYKRSNEQLNNQVNEQRKQILHFQDQIKRERSELANRQLLEQRTLKEQLEVHIQTIGILVGEKQELQGSVTQLQRTLVTKESENSELSGRLQAVRQKITELEKNNASLSADLDKYKDDFNHVRQERDRYQTANYTHGKNNEDLLQQVEELKVKLDTKVSENGELTKTNDEISFKLKQAELIVQQLSTEPTAAATQSLVEKLQDERQELENRLDQVTRSLKNYQLDNEELQQRQTDEAGEFENKIRSLKEQVISLERQKQEWESKELQLQENMQSLSIQLGEIQDEEALEKQEATSRVAAQISKLTEEKQQLVEHLQKEALQNDKLKKMEAKYVHQIHELELNLGRLEEDARDRASLLETVQSDKETISRALKQNKELKDQLGLMEERFVKMTNDNMELTNQRDNEKHVARELAIKLSETAVELEETKEKLSRSENALVSSNGELNSVKEKLDGSSSEVDSLRTQNELAIKRLQDQLSQKDFELSSLREEVTTSSQRLEATQAQTVEYYKQYEEQTQKMQAIYKQLHTSEEAISQLTSENTQLRTILDGHNDIASERSDSSLDDISGQPINGKTSIEEDDFSDTESTKERVYHNNELNKSDMKMVPQGPYINGDMFDGAREDTDSSEEMDMAPRSSPPHQLSKYTSREDVVEGLSVSIRQLEMEREQLTHLIQSQQDSHKHELQQVQEHMQLQLQQQLQQQYRYVQEQFHQTLHEQQQKIMLLQEVLQKQKAQIEKNSEEEDISSFEEDNISHETLKNAFSKLQVRFKNLMDEKVSLQERIQDLEHLTDQLSFETETIEEYVTLYQTQRASLKNYYNEREKIITQLSNEKGDMQNKISQLQSLVRQLIEERQGLQQQQQQMQNIVNKRMLAHEHENVIPLDDVQSLDGEDSLLKSEDDSSFNLDNSLDSGRESPDFEYRPNEDGTTRQILQLLEQLGPSEEGGVSGWLSPEVRNRDFLPCRYCAESRLIQI